MLGLFKLVHGGVSPLTIIYYFVPQEVGGYVFLIGITESTTVGSLILKGGFSPFHFWLTKLILSCYKEAIWFLTMQKFVYYISLSLIIRFMWIFVLYLGSIFVLFQGINTFYTKLNLFYILISSGNFILILCRWEVYFCMFLLILYLWFIYNILSFSHILSYEIIFMLIGFPWGIPFFVKLGSLFKLVNFGGIIVVFFVLLLFMNLFVSYRLFFNLYGGVNYNKVYNLIILLLSFLFFIFI